MAWDNMCKERIARGLNVIDILHWNKFAIYKLLWGVEQNKDKLLVLWVHTFYIKSQNIVTMATPKQACWIIRKIVDARKWIRGNTPLQSIRDNMITKDTYNIKKCTCI